MIHYHGTPVGGKRTDVVEALTGRHAFVSYARPDDLPVVAEVCQSFALDNGAFSAWRNSGEKIDFDKYFEWVSKLYRHPGFDFCLIPDVIDGTEEENQALVMKWIRTGTRIKGVPVWHLHESLEWLGWIRDHCEMVALGSSGEYSSPGSNAWHNRMEEVMSVLCDSMGRPEIKIHGLRMLDPAIFTRYPFASADSTNMARNNNQLGRFGMYTPPTAGQRAVVIANRIEIQNSPGNWVKKEQMVFDLK